MNDKLLVTVAPCIPPYLAVGIPGLDLSPQGIANEVVDAYNSGANVVHLHVWDENGKPTMETHVFEQTIALIRARCDIIIEGSTGGINDLSPAERSVALGTDIELASLNAGSVNYDQGVYINSPQDIEYWAKEMHRRQIKPDISIFEAGMISNSIELIEQGWIDPPFIYGFVLGQHGALPATPKNVLFLKESVPPHSVWSVVGHGGDDLTMSVLSMNMGGHVRAGFEDNPYYRPGEFAKSNAQMIDRLVRIARELGREVASPAEVRQMLSMPARAKPA